MELAYWPPLRGSSDDAEANVDEDAALVPELSEGAEIEEEDPEFETDVLVRELFEFGGAVPPANGAETLLALVRKGARVLIKPSELRKKLFECRVAFGEAKVTCLWRWEMDRILSESIMHKVGLVRNSSEMISAQGTSNP